MKIISTFFLLIACLTSFGQKAPNSIKIYKVTTYLHNGTLIPAIQDTRLDTLTGGNIKTSPVYFLRQYYGFYLPDSLENSKYKSQKIVIGKQNNNTSPAKYPTTYTVYDSLSRVIAFGKTGCMVCEFLPFECKLTYNAEGNIEKVTKSDFGPGNDKILYAIYYSPGGDVRQFNIFFPDGILNKRIELVQK
jgi:hypothetical protein